MSDRYAKGASRYTLDRAIPGAFEGETVTRRRMMTVTAATAGGVASAAFLLPALGFAVGPVFKSTTQRWESVGPFEMFNQLTYLPVALTVEPNIGEAGKTTAYVRVRNPSIDTGPYGKSEPAVAISTRCAHLGCPVRWVEAAERFICPCHGGVYDLLGRRVSGPPVRPLDRFFTRLNAKRELELGPRFSVNSQLRRFSPRNPGEPLDGIGQYLYPARPGAQI